MMLKILVILCLSISALAAEIEFKASPNLPKTVHPLHAPGIHNLFAVTTNIYSGSSPEGDEAFVALAKLGIKTIITVDGAKPDVELARKHGLRYVHLPHGYDGINTNLQAMIVKAAETSSGPVFVHCHHGKHRGPAAVAVLCMANENWNKDQATAWLHAAGTATNYIGLYDVVKDFKRPTSEQLNKLPAQLPEVAKVSGLIDAMVEIDNRWDNLKAVRAAGYKTPKESPDIVPANEAFILWEHYRETQRLPEAGKQGKEFLNRLVAAEAEAKTAAKLLRDFLATPTPAKKTELDQTFDAIGKSCVTCHKQFRDPAGINSKSFVE